MEWVKQAFVSGKLYRHAKRQRRLFKLTISKQVGIGKTLVKPALWSFVREGHTIVNRKTSWAFVCIDAVGVIFRRGNITLTATMAGLVRVVRVTTSQSEGPGSNTLSKQNSSSMIKKWLWFQKGDKISKLFVTLNHSLGSISWVGPSLKIYCLPNSFYCWHPLL